MKNRIIVLVLVSMGTLSLVQRVTGDGEQLDCYDTDSVPCVEAESHTDACRNGNTASYTSTAGQNMVVCVADDAPNTGRCHAVDKFDCTWTVITVDCWGKNTTETNSMDAWNSNCK